MKSIRAVVVLALSLPAVAIAADDPPAAPEAHMSAEECEVWSRELSFAQSVAEHDAEAFAAHIEADAAFAAESPQPLRGRKAIVAGWTGLIEGRQLRLSWYPTRTTIGGVAGIASSSGPALYEDLRPDASPRYRIGAFHSVWHKGADHVWRVLFDDGIQPVPATWSQAEAFRAGRQASCPRG